MFFTMALEDAPVEQEMKLSDAFMAECDKISVEVVVRFINVNYEKGAELLETLQYDAGIQQADTHDPCEVQRMR